MRNRCDIVYYYRSQYAGRTYIYNKMYTRRVRRVDVMRELIDFPEGNLKTNSNGMGTYLYRRNDSSTCRLLLYIICAWYIVLRL